MFYRSNDTTSLYDVCQTISPVPEACLVSKPAYLVSKLNTHLFQIGISPSIPIYRDVPGRMK